MQSHYVYEALDKQARAQALIYISTHSHTHTHINSVIHTHWETAHAHHQAPINAELHI